MWTLFRIALRNVLRNRRRTLITLAALLLGVGVMVSIRGVLNGLQNAMIVGVVEGQTGAVQVHRKGYLKNVLSSPLDLDMPADEGFLAKVRAVPGVTSVAARIQFAGLVNVGEQTLFLAALAVDPMHEFQVCPLRLKALGPGTRFGEGAPEDGVVLTTELAYAVGAKAGVEGALLAGDKDGSMSGENIHLTGTMNLNMPGEKKVGLIPLALAQRLLKMEGRATELVVGVDRLEAVDDIAARLRVAVGPEYEVHTWNEIAWFVTQAMARQNFILSLVAAVFMVLMLLGVANTMLMSVLERTREVGTMMAVGVRRAKIVQLFLLEALGIGALGGLVGGAAGAVVVFLLNRRGIEVTAPGANVPFTIRPVVSPEYLVFVVALAALGAVTFALYPAWRASRLRPVQALAGQ